MSRIPMLLRNRTSPVWALIFIFTPWLISASDRWEPRAQGISRRTGNSAIWTGTEMLVWGGWAEGDAARGDGGRYNPATDSWAPISNSNVPSARVEPTAVWTGHEMIIFGGIAVTGGGSTEWASLNTGARY